MAGSRKGTKLAKWLKEHSLRRWHWVHNSFSCKWQKSLSNHIKQNRDFIDPRSTGYWSSLRIEWAMTGSRALGPQRWGIRPREHNLLHISFSLVFAGSYPPIWASPVEKRLFFFSQRWSLDPKVQFWPDARHRVTVWVIQRGRGTREKWEEETFHQIRGWRN